MTTSLRPNHVGLAALVLLLTLLGVSVARAADPVARAVLFYAPTCPHCHYVLDEVVPPLQARYGERLVVQTIDVSTAEGQALYQAAIAAFAIPEERLGVPTLVFGTTVLVGSEEIPAQLPALIEGALAVGGNSWPAIPGLNIPEVEPAAPATAQVASPFQRDPLANSLALLLLLTMVISVVAVALTTRPPLDRPLTGRRVWVVPLLAVAGITVSMYLALVEVPRSRSARRRTGPPAAPASPRRPALRSSRPSAPRRHRGVPRPPAHRMTSSSSSRVHASRSLCDFDARSRWGITVRVCCL